MPAELQFHVPEPGDYWAHTWVVADEFVICLTQEGDIPKDLWARFIEDVRNPKIKAVLGLSIGAVSVTSIQRKTLAEATKDKHLLAVLESRIARGMITALMWLGLNIAAYSWEHIDQAFDTLSDYNMGATEIGQAVKKLMELSQAPNVDRLSMLGPIV